MNQHIPTYVPPPSPPGARALGPTSAAGCTVRMTIGTEMERLSNEVTDLLEMIGVLKTQLTPVLRDTEPSNPSVRTDEPDPSTALSALIRARRADVVGAAAELRSIMHHPEL